MASLGSLGKAKQPIDLDFEWFGRTVRVHPQASNLVEIDFLEKAKGIDLDGIDLDNPTNDDVPRVLKLMRLADDAVMGSVRRLIHPDDWDTFWQAAIDNGQTLQDLQQLQRTLIEAVADFRTGQPSDSPPGPTPTRVSSEVVSSSPEPSPFTPAATRSLARLEGRPDLQVAILRSPAATANGAPVSA